MRLHRDNSGITLVELIICIAISAIIITMIAVMINTASKSFRRTSEDVNLSMEAQITMNQLSTYIMEASDVYENSEGVTDEDKKYVLMYEKYETSEGATVTTTYHVLYYRAALDCLYIITYTDPATVDRSTVQDNEAEYLLAEYITGIDISKDAAKVNVQINLGLRDRTYSTSKTITLRNAK